MHTTQGVSGFCEQQLKHRLEIAHQTNLDKLECFCQKQWGDKAKTATWRKNPTKTTKQNRASTQVVPRKHGRPTYLTDEVPNDNQVNATFRCCQSKGSWSGFSENPHFSEIEHLITPTALPSTTFGKWAKRCDTDHTTMRNRTIQDWKASRKWSPLKTSVQRYSSS